MMEHTNCNFCNNNDTKLLFYKKDKLGLSDFDFKVVQCQICGLIYINPRPSEDEIAKFYPDTYSWRETLTAESKFTKMIRKLEKIYRYHLLHYETSKLVKVAKRKTGRLLDVGCGTGDRLDIFRRLGFDVYGVEISQSAEYAKKHLGLNVTQGDLFKAAFPDSFFDIITLHNVLEHTHNPQKVIAELNRIIKKDGIVAIQVPNTNCIQYKLFQKRWAAVDVPRDLYYFSIPLLKKILSKENFAITNIDHLNSWWHPPTLVITLFPNLDPQKAWAKEKVKGSPVLKRLLWIFWTLSLSPLTMLESLMGRGAIITVYTKRLS